MGKQFLSDEQYYRKVYGGWLGKNIGGTLGVPVEGRKELLDLTFYPVIPDKPLENDDLDMQLVWLHALEQYGVMLTSDELGREWMEHIFFPFDEYGFALTNLRRGLRAPVAGWFNNPFNDCMGSPIRSEIWAMVAPGMPKVAAYYAYQDAIVDHAGGEGVYGEMFFAALESAAFVESDRDRLIGIGLDVIPPDCRTAKALRDLLRWHGEGKSWTEARACILEKHGHPNFTDAPQNIAFTILGWLYGEDFGDAILKAVNCGYDTDCTGATLGAILGIIGGPESLPEVWVKPVGDRVVASPPIKGFPVPFNLDELTRRTMRVGQEVQAVWDGRKVEGYMTDFRQNRYFLPQGTKERSSLEVTVDYGGEGPAIGLRQERAIAITLTNHSVEAWEGRMELAVPDDWEAVPGFPFKLQPGQSAEWNVALCSGAAPASSYDLLLRVLRLHDDQLWNAETVQLSMTGASHWTIEGPAVSGESAAVFAGNRLDLEKALATEAPGIYKAKTKLFNPAEKTVKLIAASTHPVKAILNGEILLDCKEKADFMPAYHRAPESQCAVITLPAGEHLLEIELVKDSMPMEICVVPVATRQTKQPGANYCFTDVLFLPATTE